MLNYSVYIIRCRDGSYYTGVTNNYELRFLEHQIGIDPKCYTYKRRPLELAFIEQYRDVRDAISAEKQIKRWTRKKKKALINSDKALLKQLSYNPLCRRLDTTRSHCHNKYMKIVTTKK